MTKHLSPITLVLRKIQKASLEEQLKEDNYLLALTAGLSLFIYYKRRDTIKELEAL